MTRRMFLPLVMVLMAGCGGDNPLTGSGATGDAAGADTNSDDDRSVLFSTLRDDADQDGVPDDEDLCPDDPAKVAPGACGCGQDDGDRDGDGEPDCIDECPDNPQKIQAGAKIECEVIFADPDREFSAYYPAIELNLLTACGAWTRELSAIRNVTIEVEVRFADIGTAVASSKTVARVQTENGIDTYEQGALAEIRTGVDPNEEIPDAVVTIGYENLTGGLWWFDPDPATRQAELPEDRIDGYSAFLHEMGHVFAYNGWRNFQNGELPGNFLSTYDEQIVFDGANFFFVGQSAVEAYGGPVPLTYGNIAHLANREPRPGSDLIDELMNGVVTRRGKRRDISSIDLAILADIGAPMRSQAVLQGACENAPAATRPAPVLIVGPTPSAQERPLPPQQFDAQRTDFGCSHPHEAPIVPRSCEPCIGALSVRAR
ncbi:MAG: hypothetical protein GXP29_02655 [Planctomycetes bacterium]|nr:hypothetical protein [Planctomycetota bacterium]